MSSEQSLVLNVAIMIINMQIFETKSELRDEFDCRNRIKKLEAFMMSFILLAMALAVILLVHAFAVSCTLN